MKITYTIEIQTLKKGSFGLDPVDETNTQAEYNDLTDALKDFVTDTDDLIKLNEYEDKIVWGDKQEFKMLTKNTYEDGEMVESEVLLYALF